MHLATPMQGENVLAAALDGTRHVLEASAEAGVARVVLTSSGLAALRPRRKVKPGEVITEEDWTDTDRPRIDDYTRAKTLAERDAWRLAGELGLSLTSILPGAILGPALGPDRSGWLGLIGGMLAGKMRKLPPIRLQMVDVRDLAELHIAALLAPEAAGQRYIAAGDALSLRAVAEILRADLGDAAQKVGTGEMPAWGLRLAGLVSPQARQAVPLLKPSPLLSAAKAERELGWAPRPMRRSIGDTARSLMG
jgi:dihydroflavonol-4-reductase